MTAGLQGREAVSMSIRPVAWDGSDFSHSSVRFYREVQVSGGLADLGNSSNCSFIARAFRVRPSKHPDGSYATSQSPGTISSFDRRCACTSLLASFPPSSTSQP